MLVTDVSTTYAEANFSHLLKMAEDGFNLDGFRLEVHLYPTARL